MTKSSSSLGEIWVSSAERLFPEPKLDSFTNYCSLLLGPEVRDNGWNQWCSTLVVNLHFSKCNQEITKELRMLSLSSCPQATQQWRELRHLCCPTTFNPTNATCVSAKGQGHASIVDLLLGCPEMEAFRLICAVMRTIILWNVERKHEIF